MHEQKYTTCSYFPTNFTFITSAPDCIHKKQQKHLLFPTQITAHLNCYSITASSHNEHTQKTIHILSSPLRQRALFCLGMKYEHPAHTICSQLDHHTVTLKYLPYLDMCSLFYHSCQFLYHKIVTLRLIQVLLPP